MSLDEVFFALADKKAMGSRRRESTPLELVSRAGKDGLIKGRAADGTPIAAKIKGKSLARQLMEKQQKEEEEQKAREAASKKRSNPRFRKGKR